MADDDDDSKGLVEHEEIPESIRFAGQNVVGYGSNEAVFPEDLRSVATGVTPEQQDLILAVFVVSFDTRKG